MHLILELANFKPKNIADARYLSCFPAFVRMSYEGDAQNCELRDSSFVKVYLMGLEAIRLVTLLPN